MSVLTIVGGPLETNAYLVINDVTKEAILIDAPPGVKDEVTAWEKREKGTIRALLVTHAHIDHIGDAEAIRRSGIPLYAHPEGGPCFADPGAYVALRVDGLTFQRSRIDQSVQDGTCLTLAGFSVETLFTPGHCIGSVCFSFPEEGWCFTGDLIFRGGVGRVDLLGGDREQLCTSVREKVYTLPDETCLFPGHGPPTTVGREKTTGLLIVTPRRVTPPSTT